MYFDCVSIFIIFTASKVCVNACFEVINTTIDLSPCFKTGLRGHLPSSQCSYMFFKHKRKHSIPPLSCTGVGNAEVSVVQVSLGA